MEHDRRGGGDQEDHGGQGEKSIQSQGNRNQAGGDGPETGANGIQGKDRQWISGRQMFNSAGASPTTAR